MRFRGRDKACIHSGVVLLAGTAALLGGCSTFERDWAAPAPAVDPAGLEGRWRGTWRSDANGHHGALRCILTLEDGETLHAQYHAKYGGFLSFGYEVSMTVRQESETYHFAGEADLGWLAGGMYEYEGTVVRDEFTSTYRSARDHGTFEMTRVDEAGD